MREIEAIEECKNRVSKYVPSTSQIAHIAAILANGKTLPLDHPLVIANEAIKLWEACESMQKTRIYERAKKLHEAEVEISKLRGSVQVERIGFPTPQKYPVPFDECLRLLMPGKKRSEDRIKIYRDYIRDSLRVSNFMGQGNWSGKPFESTPIPSDEEVAKIMAKYKAEGFSENWYPTTREFFLRWFPDYEAKKLSARAKKGAAAKWKKKRNKNG
jgi:hypothetical protein